MSTRNYKTSRTEILRVLRDHPDPALKSTEIVEELPAEVTTQAVNYHLKKLREDGAVESKSFGSSAVGWWITEQGERLLWEIEHGERESV